MLISCKARQPRELTVHSTVWVLFQSLSKSNYFCHTRPISRNSYVGLLFLLSLHKLMSHYASITKIYYNN